MKISDKSLCSDLEMDKMFGVEDQNRVISTKSGDICRAKCEAENSCEYWSWESATIKCHLFPSKSVTDTPGVMSGEKVCKGRESKLNFDKFNF